MLRDCVSMIYVLQWFETGNDCWFENYMTSYDKQCLESLVHKQDVHVKFIFGLLNNTLPAEHETSKSLVGQWSEERSTGSTMRTTRRDTAQTERALF